MKLKQGKKLIILSLIAVFAIFSLGCSKSISAEAIANDFLEGLETKAYKMVHKSVESGEVLEVIRDANGATKGSYVYEDGVTSDIYFIDDTYTLYLDGELNTDYTQEELKEYMDIYLSEASFYVNDTLEVFNLEIDSDIIDLKDENIVVAVGEYDDGSAYKYTFEKDGKYFELIDIYDNVLIEMDETLKVELPN